MYIVFDKDDNPIGSFRLEMKEIMEIWLENDEDAEGYYYLWDVYNYGVEPIPVVTEDVD